MGGKEQDYVQDAFASNWIAPIGSNINGFESDLKAYLGPENEVTALSSGTAAVHMALMLIGVSQNDDVICQSFTFSASANPILYLGATPIFIDSEKDTWNMSPDLLELAIKDRLKKGKKPKAIIAVDLYGMPYKASEIQAIADKYEIPVVEDSAEALGSCLYNRPCGTLAHCGVFSFNGNKIITTSAGGALITKSKKLKEKAVFLATQAREDAPHYQHTQIGYNYRMSNVLAGIGRGQMEVLSQRILARRANFEFYKQALAGLNNIEFLEEPTGFYSNRWLTCILTNSYEKRETLRLALLKNDIEARPLWKPLHTQPVFRAYLSFTDSTSESLFGRGLCLPSGSNLSKADLSRISKILIQILK